MRNTHWSTLQKIGFRFLFIFFILIASPWYWVPILRDYLYTYFYLPSLFVQNYILKLNKVPVWEHAPTGSGDTLDDWILLLTWVGVAIVGCIFWSVLDRKRDNYIILNYWLKVVLRYYVAIVVFFYGFDKIFPVQMPFPSLAQMHTPLGDLSPMRLAWLFIGYSVPYEIFGGLMEATSAILLSIRRTQLLGSLMMLGTLANVVMLNFSYDIPVKLFSSELLIMTLYLALSERRRLLNFFILNQPVEPAQSELNYEKKKHKVIRWSLLILFWAGGFGYYLYSNYNYWQYAQNQTPFSLRGSYEVKEFMLNDSVIQSPTDTLRWSQVIMDNGYMPNQGSGMIKRGTYLIDRAFFSVDSVNVFNITFRDDPVRNFKGKFENPSAEELVVSGISAGDSIQVKLQKIKKEFKLEKKPFHWVSANPY